MATRLVELPDLDRDNVFQRVRREIEELFHSLIEKVNERREVLLTQLNQWEEEFNRTRASCIQSLEEIKRERTEMEQFLATLKLNKARTSMEKGISDLSNEISEKEQKLHYPQVRFVCDRNDLNSKISKFGSLSEETDNVLVRNYTQLSNPVNVFGIFGGGKGEFTRPRGVVIDNENLRIFIADGCNYRIQVWSLEGDYLFQFGRDILQSPWEIVIFENSIYISDFTGHFLSKWCLNTFNLLKKSNTSQGSKSGQLSSPYGLDIDKEELFVVEYRNKRISVFDLNLKFKRIMANNAIVDSFCLRVRNNTIYIVESTGVIKLFSKTDQLLKTIRKLPLLSDDICHFNFDSQLNFLITDYRNNSLFILSPEGDLIHSVSFTEFGLTGPCGIDIGRDRSIVLSFQSGSKAIAIF